MVAALVATCLAMYPLLFFGRSLVTPNNGGAAMLYGQPPFVPGSGDFEVEDVRGVDVGAMMWAFVPYSKMQREALADGEFPLWNRHAGPGVSLWGQGQSFFLDPLHWHTLLGRDEAPGWDLKFAAHRFVLSWGVGVAALAAPVAWLPAVVAAAVAPFIGFFAFRLNHPVAFALSYAPWVLAGWFLLARATSRRQLAGATLLLACASALVLFASPPKEGLVVLLVAEATGLLGLVLHVRPLARLPGRLGLSGLAGVAVVLVTMPQWLVFLETLRASVTNYDAPAVHFANPGYTIGMVLGGLTEGMPVPGLNTCSMALLVAALLSPAALLRSRAILACVAGAAAAIAVAHGVIPAAWIEAVPLAANIHSISVTFLTAALVPLLVASALGAEALLQRSRARVILMTLGTLAAAAWTFDGVGGVAGLGRFPAWLALVALAGAVILPLTVHASVRTFPRVLPALAVAGLGLLLLSPDGQHLDTGRPPIDRVLVQPRERVPLSLSSPAVDAIHDTATAPVRVLGLDYNLLPGTPALYDLEGVGGPDALYLGHADELRFAARPEARRSWLAVFRRTDLARQAPLLDMLNVGYLLAAFDQADSIGPAEPLRAPDVLRAIPRPTAWPRAFFAGRVSTYSTPEALIEQVRRAGRPMAAIQDGDAAAAALTSGLLTRRDAVVPADNYVLTTNTTQFHLRTGAGGVAVLAESYMPDDFIATVNGAEVPYFRVNHAFKAVVIPAAGEWTVKFEYRPHHWHLALAAAGGGALILFALAIAALPRARRNP
jgi:hypothetical protein